MTAKKWLSIVFLLTGMIMIPLGGINYFIDPLWTFSHEHRWNQTQSDFDERQQKTNYVEAHQMEAYDSLLLGSSRSTHINQNDFKKMHLFNYAVSGMYPHEYKGYIDFFKRKIGHPLKYIVIGADFYNILMPSENAQFKEPRFYIQNSEDFFYKYRMLFTLDLFKKSLKNIRYTYKGKDVYYDRKNIKYSHHVSESARLKAYTRNLKQHTEAFVKRPLNPDYLELLIEIKRENPESQIVVFTSPITANLLVSILRSADKLEDYKTWLRNLVDIFGQVYHFMDINSITTNLQNYPDDDHYYDHVAKALVARISGRENEHLPKDFGVILEKSTIEAYLEKFEKAFALYQVSNVSPTHK